MFPDRGVIVIAALLASSASAHADPCAAERATADRLDAELARSPAATMASLRARDALIACERRIEDAEQAAHVAQQRAARARIAAEQEARIAAEQDAYAARQQKEAAAAEAKKRAEEDFRDRIAADPKNQRLAFSALLCGWISDERNTMREIRELHQAARIGGVLNMTEVNDRQTEIMAARTEQARARAALKHMKANPIRCADPVIKRVAGCVARTALLADCDAEAKALSAIANPDER